VLLVARETIAPLPRFPVDPASLLEWVNYVPDALGVPKGEMTAWTQSQED
jgi:hypothetical protein